jgi:hypothetical protein
MTKYKNRTKTCPYTTMKVSKCRHLTNRKLHHRFPTVVFNVLTTKYFLWILSTAWVEIYICFRVMLCLNLPDEGKDAHWTNLYLSLCNKAHQKWVLYTSGCVTQWEIQTTSKTYTIIQHKYHKPSEVHLYFRQ